MNSFCCLRKKGKTQKYTCDYCRSWEEEKPSWVIQSQVTWKLAIHVGWELGRLLSYCILAPPTLLFSVMWFWGWTPQIKFLLCHLVSCQALPTKGIKGRLQKPRGWQRDLPLAVCFLCLSISPQQRFFTLAAAFGFQSFFLCISRISLTGVSAEIPAPARWHLLLHGLVLNFMEPFIQVSRFY